MRNSEDAWHRGRLNTLQLTAQTTREYVPPLCYEQRRMVKDVAAGLAVLIGRQISEAYLNFAPKTSWAFSSVRCQKTSPRYWFGSEIPTWSFSLILTAIEHLQTVLRIEDLKLDSAPKMPNNMWISATAVVVKTCQAALFQFSSQPFRPRQPLRTSFRLPCHRRRSLVLPSQHSWI